jgi:hypothetical protein
MAVHESKLIVFMHSFVLDIGAVMQTFTAALARDLSLTEEQARWHRTSCRDCSS